MPAMSTKGNNWTMGCPDGLCWANIDGIMMKNDYLLGLERNAEYSTDSQADSAYCSRKCPSNSVSELSAILCRILPIKSR